MDYSQLAYPLLGAVNIEARSALPCAPVIEASGAKRKRRQADHLRGRLANVLHRAAWALEPGVHDGTRAPEPAARIRPVPSGAASSEPDGSLQLSSAIWPHWIQILSSRQR